MSLLPSLPIPIDLSLPLDGRAVAFTLGLSLVAALLSGLAPALARVEGGSRRRPESGRARRTGAACACATRSSSPRSRSASCSSSAPACSCARCSARPTIDPGFDPHGVELASLDLSLAGYTPDDRASVRARADRARARAARRAVGDPSAIMPLGDGGLGLGGLTVPGVDAARRAAASSMPTGTSSRPATSRR